MYFSYLLSYSWSTNDLRTNASVCLNNIGVSTAAFNLVVRQGSIDAHGGVVGGYLELHDISADGINLVFIFLKIFSKTVSFHE